MKIISFNSLLNKDNITKIKEQLLNIIKEIKEKNGWTQTYTAEILGIDQPKVSQIINGKTNGFSLERLLLFLKKLGHEITITMAENQKINTEVEKIKHEAEFS